MNGITLQWLRSEPMSDVMGRDRFSTAEAALVWLLLSAAVLLVLCLILLIVRIVRKRKRYGAEPLVMGEDSVTRELPVAEIQAAVQTLHILADILYCESREIIS